MLSSEIRKKFLDFFAENGHMILPSAPLVSYQDPSLLFNIAGMQPLKPYYLGLKEPPAPRLASAQKCLRTVDLDQVGRTPRHLTFFEMLGNFAPTGAYFKREAINYGFELLVKVFGIDPKRIYATIYPDDEEAYSYWRNDIGLPSERIFRLEDNFWQAGSTGPCGPDSEIHYDMGAEYGCGRPNCGPGCDCDRFVEVWNLVFMQYNRREDGTLEDLGRKGVDTGAGLERLTAVLQGKSSNFQTDLFSPMLNVVQERAGVALGEDKVKDVSIRLILDHSRAIAFLIADGVFPSNESRGYVLRRLIRSAFRHERLLKADGALIKSVEEVINFMGREYRELDERRSLILDITSEEIDRFSETLEHGSSLFEDMVKRYQTVLPGDVVFKLYDTYGFPLELTLDMAKERGVEVDVEGFKQKLNEQRLRSKAHAAFETTPRQGIPSSVFTGYSKLEDNAVVTAIWADGKLEDTLFTGMRAEVYLDKTPFYAESGGQVGDRGVIIGPEGQARVVDCFHPQEGLTAHLVDVIQGKISVGSSVVAKVDASWRNKTTAHHSATHLLHKALRVVLGESAVQAGSYVGADRCTFDFRHPRALTEDEIKEVFEIVNDSIQSGLEFKERYTTYDEAVKSGAMALFGEKYADTVRVVCFGDFTCELCGGTHVKNTKDIGVCVFISEQSIGAGIRRIEFLAGEPARQFITKERLLVRNAAKLLGCREDEIPVRLESVLEAMRWQQKLIEKLQAQGAQVRLSQIARQDTIAGVKVLIEEHNQDADHSGLRNFADIGLERIGGSGVYVGFAGDRVVVKVSSDHISKSITAAAICKQICSVFGGRGGGSDRLAQGGGLETIDIDKALDVVRGFISDMVEKVK